MTSVALPRATRARSQAWSLGLILATGYLLGIALFVTAYRQARTDTSFAHFTIFWVGLLVVLAVTILGGIELRASTRKLTWLLVAFALFTYLPKFMMSVNSPAYFDEYGHYRHLQDMISTGNIGAGNAILPVVQYYPGLGLLTIAVHFCTGLGLWHSGQIVIVVAHCATLVLIFALSRSVGLNRGAAFAAALVYSANPSFMYFDSQYAYESLAIPMLLAAAVCTVRARRAESKRVCMRYLALGIVAELATMITHHITSIVMIAMCLLIAGFVPSTAIDRALFVRQRVYAWVITLVGLVCVAAWTLGVSTGTRRYLLPTLTTGLDQLLERFTGASGTGRGEDTSAAGGHTPFSGTTVPSYEHLFAFAAPALIVLILGAGLWRIWRSPVRRSEFRLSAPFWLLAFAYLGSLPLALTSTGGEAAHRSWPFFYIGAAIFAVWGFGRPYVDAGRYVGRLGTGSTGALLLTSLMLLALNMGNITAGTNITYRFPGPFEFGYDNRFQTAELAGLVTWADANLQPGAGVVTDRFTEQALMVGTKLNFATTDESYVNNLYTTPANPDSDLRAYLHARNFKYFVLDTRILTETPGQAFFQNYLGPESVNKKALRSIQDGIFIQLLHQTQHYRVYVINN